MDSTLLQPLLRGRECGGQTDWRNFLKSKHSNAVVWHLDSGKINLHQIFRKRQPCQVHVELNASPDIPASRISARGERGSSRLTEPTKMEGCPHLFLLTIFYELKT